MKSKALLVGLVLVPMIIALTLSPLLWVQQVEGGLFSRKNASKAAPVERKFDRLMRPVGRMFKLLSSCTKSFEAKQYNKESLLVCVASAFENTGTRSSTSMDKFAKIYKSSLTRTCIDLNKLVAFNSPVFNDWNLVDSSEKLTSLMAFKTACVIISVNCKEADVYKRLTAKKKVE